MAALDLKLNPDTVSGKLSHKLSSPYCVEVEIRGKKAAHLVITQRLRCVLDP